MFSGGAFISTGFQAAASRAIQWTPFKRLIPLRLAPPA